MAEQALDGLQVARLLQDGAVGVVTGAVDAPRSRDTCRVRGLREPVFDLGRGECDQALIVILPEPDMVEPITSSGSAGRSASWAQS